MSESSPLPHDPLSLVEARILGCLLEKEATTPDLYPLTLNSLVNACNQKSNRAPVLELDDDAVHAGLDSLRAKGLVLLVTQTAARVAKYKHSLERHYPLPNAQVAVLAELLLRGPQTVGELRTRCERMTPLGNLDAAREEIASLTGGACPLLMELPRQTGKKDARFSHLLSGLPDFESEQAVNPASGPVKVDVALTLPPEAEERIASLEATVASQASQIESLRAELAEFRAQFE